MRRHYKPIGWGFILGLIVILLLESLGWAQKAEPKSKVAAMVNGESILLDEIESILKKRMQETGPALTPLTATQQRHERLEILSAMIDETLVKQFLRDNGGKIDVAEVDKTIGTLVESLKPQNKSLADYCKESNQTEQQLRNGILQMLQMNKYVKEQTTEEDLKKYYEANKDFFDKVTVRCSHIVLRLASSATKLEREQARQKLLGIRAELVEGKKDFAVLAKEHSHCPSAPKGGDLGFIYRKWQVDENFARSAFSLKVNEISDIVETDFGYHLIKVTERKAGTPSKYDLCVEDARDCFTEDLRQNLLNKLRQKGKIEIMLP